MSNPIHYPACPCCGSNNISPVLTAKDYTVTSEVFTIMECADCTLRFTQDIENEENIGRYYQSENYVSHSDTNKGLINKLYHYVRTITLKNKYRILCTFTKKTTGNLLDIGAGTGAFAHYMQQTGWKVTGLEPDKTARDVAFTKHQLSLDTPEKLFEFEEGTFDAITMWHVLEHVHNLDGYFNAFKKILTKEGKLFIAVPNYTSFDAQHYQEYWAAYDVPRHLYHFSPLSIEKLAKKYGFMVSAIKPMWYDSFYISMISEQYKTGKSNLIKACFVGLTSNWKTLLNPRNCSSIIYIIEKI